jgi:hypothetical protein
MSERQRKAIEAWRGCQYFTHWYCRLEQLDIAREWMMLGKRHVRPLVYDEPYEGEA